MRVALTLVLTVLAAPLLASPSGANHVCDWAVVEIEGAAGATLYVTHGPDAVTITQHGQIWLQAHTYLESNGIPGLQRGGFSLIGDSEECQAFAANPDTFVF